MTPEKKAAKMSVISKAQARADYRNELFVPQKKLLYQIKESFAAGKPVAVCAGQRAGKNVVATVLGFDYQDVKVLGKLGGAGDTLRHLQSCYDALRLYHANVVSFHDASRFFELVYKTVTDKTLIILEEPYWWSGRDGSPFASEAFFTELYNQPNGTKNILAIGSRGPAMFKRFPTWNYATWDLNPNWKREDFAQEFKNDPEAAERDFCG